MSEFFEFKDGYNSSLLRGRDVTPKQEILREYAKKSGSPNKKLLDIGCGTTYKTLKLANYFQMIIGLDPSDDLLSIAKHHIQSQQISNVHLIKGIAEALPFKANQFDVATSILAWWDPKEVTQVLKPNGIFLIECLGPEDKKSFTQFFGKDSNGWRGANLNTDLSTMKKDIQTKLHPFFNTVETHHITWQTAYCVEGLWALLNNTKTTVRDFDPISDRVKFEEAIKTLQRNNEIVLTQNRLITAARRK